uniref:Uncharacterized protein n=1 Tax=Arundo donax TaxID=35708 RepID=A0A0A9H2V2_ARUDO
MGCFQQLGVYRMFEWFMHGLCGWLA